MKIAYFTDTYLPNVDGVVNSILEMRKQLERKGNEVYVFTSGSSTDRARNTDPHVFYFRSIPFPPYPQYKLALFPYIDAAAKARKNGVELVHSHAIASMGMAARRTASVLDTPLVGTFHTFIASPSITDYLTKSRWVKKVTSRVMWKAISLFYKPFDVVTAPSHVVTGMLKEHAVPHVTTIPNGIDAAFYSPKRNAKEKLFGLGKEKIVLVAGRLGWEKNVNVVIKSARHVLKEENARFIVTGEGPAKKHYEMLAEKEGVSSVFEFTGFVPKNLLPYYYSAADCVVSASTFETQGLALMEAQSCGTPCVGANALAIPETINDRKTGYLFEPFNEEDCAEKILSAITMPAKKRKAMQQNARKKALLFSTEKMATKMLNLYESLV